MHIPPSFGVPSIMTDAGEPSTRGMSQVLIRVLALPVPVTAGRPYSRQTMAACGVAEHEAGA